MRATPGFATNMTTHDHEADQPFSADFFEQSDGQTTSTVTALPTSGTRSRERILPMGCVLDGVYEVGEVLGTGGMGQVYTAHDRRLGRDVAVKVCWPYVSKTALATEAKVLAALRHPGLVAVHWFGTHDGIEYMVVERLRGVTLQQYLQQRGAEQPLPVAETLDILIQLADTLAVIHRAGYIHRDVKPANIMLVPGNRVVLLDLGVSLRSEQAEHEEKLAGSPHYIAPEAITATMSNDRGYLVDIYSLGILAFEMLTGRRPFDGPDTMSILNMHLEAARPRPSQYSQDIPDHLDRLIAEMMHKDPAHRPRSLDLVVAWLRAIREGRSALRSRDNMSVLIADDDPDVRALLSSFVKQVIPGTEVHCASDGEQAIRKLHATMPDVLLLDLNMPGASGLEVCMHLCGTPQANHTVVAAISGDASPKDRLLLKQLGVVQIIDKASSSENILQPLVNILRQVQRSHLGPLGRSARITSELGI